MSEIRIFKRKIYDRMLQWKQERDGKTALLVKGARRVGKSAIVEKFARQEYETYMLIDCCNTGVSSSLFQKCKACETFSVYLYMVS